MCKWVWKGLLFFVYFSCLVNARAQQPNALRLNGVCQFTQPNLHAFDVRQSPWNEHHFGDYICAVIQFYNLPDNFSKQRLKQATGILLLQYVPDHCYFAIIPLQVSKKQLADFSIRGIYTLTPDVKLAPSLKEGAYASHILAGDNTLRVNVLCFKHPDTAAMRPNLASYGLVVRQWPAAQPLFEVLVAADKLHDLARLPFVQYIEPGYGPVQYDNQTEVRNHRANYLNSGLVFDYDGKGVWIALNDDGLVANHIDVVGRIDNDAVQGLDEGNHGNHLAGTILGAGNLEERARGHAPGASIKTYMAYANYQPVYGGWYDVPVSYYNPGVTITNTAVSDIVCNEGYNSLSQLLDQQVHDFPLLNHVLSAGNSGQENCGPLPGFYNITGGHKVAKNCITVGAIDKFDKLFDLSSRGPARDGRLKPECVASGVDVYSTFGSNDYKILSGTSMACAAVSGSLALLTQAYRQMYNKTPPSSLLKAALLNTCDDMGWAGPDWKHGYGRINVRNAYKVLELQRFFFDTIENNQKKNYTFKVPGGVRQLRIMLYWHDAPAALGAPKDLVNDLQLQLILPNGNLVNPWILDPTPVKDSLNKPAWRGIDTLNNCEQITLNNPAAADYTLMITGAHVPMGPQPFVVVYDFLYDEVVLTYPIGGESWAPYQKEIIRWDTYGQLKPLTLEISYDDGATWSVVAQLDSFARYYEITVPPIVAGFCRVRISRPDASSESGAVSIMNVPTGLTWNQICPLNAKLSWQPVPGATQYEVYLLKSTSMELIGTTSKTFFDITGLNVNKTDWVSVRALSVNNVRSQRSRAYMKPTGLLNCTLTHNVAISSVAPAPYQFYSCMPLEQVPISLTVVNTGQHTMSGFTVGYKINDLAPVTESLAQPVEVQKSVTYTFQTQANLSGAGVYEISCWISHDDDQNPWDDTLRYILEILPGSVLPLPIYQNFDSVPLCETTNNCEEGVCMLGSIGLNLANNVFDHIDWRVHSGPTTGSQTGPSADYNSSDGKGRYIYVEAGSCHSKQAHWLIPCLDLTTAIHPQLTFADHMYGNGMGSLSIDVFHHGKWHLDYYHKNGNQGNQWNTNTVDLSAFAGSTIALRFRATTGTNSNSDLAVDNVQIIDAANLNVAMTTSGTFCTDSALTFYNISDGLAKTVTWLFEPDGQPAFLAGTDTAVVTFATPGVKTVTLTVSNDFKTVSYTDTFFVAEAPKAQFSFSLEDDGSFAFHNTTVGSDSFVWAFGDGTFSNAYEPTHIYATPGQYEVVLIAYNSCGHDSTSQLLIVASPPTSYRQEFWNVFPNPFDQVVCIEPCSSGDTFYEVQVFHISGVKMAQVSSQFDRATCCVQLPGLATGVYVLKLTSPTHTAFQKIVHR